MFTVGSYVINFDYVARIESIRDDGSLVVVNPRIGRWIADPARCTEYHPPIERR